MGQILLRDLLRDRAAQLAAEAALAAGIPDPICLPHSLLPIEFQSSLQPLLASDTPAPAPEVQRTQPSHREERQHERRGGDRKDALPTSHARLVPVEQVHIVLDLEVTEEIGVPPEEALAREDLPGCTQCQRPTHNSRNPGPGHLGGLSQLCGPIVQPLQVSVLGPRLCELLVVLLELPLYGPSGHSPHGQVHRDRENNHDPGRAIPDLARPSLQVEGARQSAGRHEEDYRRRAQLALRQGDLQYPGQHGRGPVGTAAEDGHLAH
mmetsp:Transcript_82348/g.254540  ORF Transcript_82348/g.254540 Transcript_82348/m.254540 type:complete len:265 (-) Transcript_82348:550-1344(-)